MSNFLPPAKECDPFIAFGFISVKFILLIKYFLRPKIKGALGFFFTLKIQILGKGSVSYIVIGKIKLSNFYQIWRALKKIHIKCKSKQIKLNLPTFSQIKFVDSF
jgi:hypothetical protein